MHTYVCIVIKENDKNLSSSLLENLFSKCFLDECLEFHQTSISPLMKKLNKHGSIDLFFTILENITHSYKTDRHKILG